MAIHRHDHPIHRHVQPLGRGGDDAQVGLMRNQPVDVRARQPVCIQGFIDDGIQRLDRELEDLVAGHVDLDAVIGRVGESARDAHRVVEQVFVPAVGVQVGGKDARLGVGLQHHRTGTVAEQHAGAAVAPVDHAREGFRTNHQRGFRRSGTDEVVGHAQRIDEARAGGVDVERGAAVGTQAMLQQAGGGREDDVGRGRAQHQQVDFGSIDAGGFERARGGLESQVPGGLSRQRDVALAYAGAFADPFVAGLDLLFQIGVGDDVVRQVAAGSDDARVRLRHALLRE